MSTDVDAPDRPIWLIGLMAVGRVLASVTALLLVFFLAPFDRPVDASVGMILAVLLVLLLALIVVQVRAIVRSPLPGLRAVEGLALTVPLLILSFAVVYFLMSDGTPSTFNEPLTRTDALYFAVMVFSTVGLGDIAPVTENGRVAVTIQMTVNLVVIGIGIRVIATAIQQTRGSRRQLPSAVRGPAPPATPPGGDRSGR